jgi:hypothetical protein
VFHVEKNSSQRIAALTLDPAVPNVNSWIEHVGAVELPAVSDIHLSISQRLRNDRVIYALADESSSIPAYDSYTIASISQTASTVTIVLNSPFIYPLGTVISISNIPDNRICYQDCPVASISEDSKTITITTTSGAAIASTTIAAINSVGTLTVWHDILRGGASNGVAVAFTSSTTTLAEIYSRRNGTDRPSGSPSLIIGDRRIAVSSTAPSRLASGAGYALTSGSEYRIEIEPGLVRVGDRSSDASAMYSTRAMLESTAPAGSGPFKRLVGASRSISATSVNANIVSVSRTTNTVVVTLDRDAVSAGFVVGQYIQVYGIANQTLFPNTTSANPLTGVSGSTITFSWTGTAGTSYGGFISIPAGQIGIGGALNIVTSVSVSASGQLTLSSTTAWACSPTDIVRVQGVRNATNGSDLGVDGLWKVVRVGAVTTNLVLGPLVDYANNVKSPVVGVLASTTCGGGVLLATTVRVHAWRAYTRKIQEVRIQGQGMLVTDNAVPVALVNSVSQGSTLSATGGTYGWPVTQGITQITDIASAALTATTTGTAVTYTSVSGGPCAIQLIYNVTAVSGTSPTLDVRVEVQDDGVNWYTLYDFPRITAVGSYRTPELRTDARTYRLIQTVGGTSPSFTRSVIRNSLSFQQPEPRCQMFDRTVSLTTLGSTTPALYCDGPSDAQLFISIGAATTPPALQLQVSEDNGATWVSVGSPLAAVANSTVRTIVTAEYPRHLRAVVTTAGSAVTANYVLIKAVGG